MCAQADTPPGRCWASHWPSSSCTTSRGSTRFTASVRSSPSRSSRWRPRTLINASCPAMKNLLRKNRNRVASLAFGYAVLAAYVHALEPTEWKNRQALKVETAGIVSVAIPNETLDAARLDLGDLRIIDQAGHEMAFLLRRGSRPAVRPIAAK